MASLSLKNICKVYPNGFEAVKDFNLEIADQEFIIFVGPSGCGKSTTLRMIAGLEDISSGELRIGDRLVNDVEPKDRDIAMVFQNYALYPHMTVYDNMAFGLKLRKVPSDEIDKMVKEAAKILDLVPYLERSPRLSPVDRDSVLPWDVLSFVILRYSLWTSLFQTLMLSFVYR
jgi:multiple sugar transport system ATP-binding protein